MKTKMLWIVIAALFSTMHNIHTLTMHNIHTLNNAQHTYIKQCTTYIH